MVKVPLVSGRRNVVSFSDGGINYIFDVQWNNRLQLYSTDIYENDVLTLSGIMLAVGLNVLDGLLDTNLTNLYCVNVGFPSTEIGFDDLDSSGYVIIDDEWVILAEEEAYYATLTDKIYAPVNIVKTQIFIETEGGDILQDTNLELMQTVGEY